MRDDDDGASAMLAACIIGMFGLCVGVLLGWLLL